MIPADTVAPPQEYLSTTLSLVVFPTSTPTTPLDLLSTRSSLDLGTMALVMVRLDDDDCDEYLKLQLMYPDLTMRPFRTDEEVERSMKLMVKLDDSIDLISYPSILKNQTLKGGPQSPVDLLIQSVANITHSFTTVSFSNAVTFMLMDLVGGSEHGTFQ